MIFILTFLACFTSALPVNLTDGSTVVINSSYSGEVFTLSISSDGKKHSSYLMQADMLFPSAGQIRIIHGDTGF